MYLKEIKISGFKSFADKISLNLDDNITCIVGPNGSGKSNIVDAVKWVLGEQSVKNLRGSKAMTDVIFSGSKSRNPLNLASVSLVFDNSDSYISLPYTEISITRKVYRSGENEYYLNNEKCRLKDIYDLFLDSGMGRYAFNIISQGEVEKVISNSPYERRVIFEEAAGVLKYKKRKEEALRKLEKTNENLTRVKDIKAELDSQIEPLREQSKRAKEYLDKKEKLENIEISLIASDLEKLNIEYEKNTKDIEELQNEIIKTSTNSSNSDVLLEKKKEELNKVNEKMVSLNNSYLSLSKEEEKLNGQKNIIKERSKYSAESSKVHDNIVSLKEQSFSINNKMLSLKMDISVLENKINDIDLLIDNENKDLKEKLNERKDLESKIYSSNMEINSLDYKIKSLTNYIEEGGNINVNAKKVLANPRIKGIHNVISKLVNISSDKMIALNSIMVGSKDYVVVDTPEVAKSCINYLKENGLGRVTFYPISVIKKRYIDNDTIDVLNSSQGYIDVLANLLEYDDKYKDIVYNLFGNVILVDSLDNANIIAKKINNKYRIVTLTGELINVGGSVTGGTIKVKSVISEKYELQNLISKKAHLILSRDKDSKILEDLISKEKEKQVKIMEIEKNKILCSEELDSKKLTYEKYSKDYEDITLEFNNLNNLVKNNFSSEEDKIITKYYEVLGKREDLEKQVKLVMDLRDKLTFEIDEINAKYRTINSNLRTLENTLKEKEINNTKISVKMDNMLSVLSENYSITFEKARANYILEIDENIARKTVNELKGIIKKLGDVNVGSIEEFERVNARYEFLTKQTNDLESAISTLLSIIDELDEVMKNEFLNTFKEIEVEFDKVFKDLFGGGEAKLKLTDKSNILETGIDIVVTPPGKKISSISLLSGGEKTLTAISLLFAILNVKKIPFCLFDEVEAALDENNVDKVGAYFKKYIGKTQLIIITHKKKTMEYANTLYGITMQESGVSKLVSVKLVD